MSISAACEATGLGEAAAEAVRAATIERQAAVHDGEDAARALQQQLRSAHETTRAEVEAALESSKRQHTAALKERESELRAEAASFLRETMQHGR